MVRDDVGSEAGARLTEEGTENFPVAMFPPLAVGDVAKSIGWHSEKLEFGTVYLLPRLGGEPVLAHLQWRSYADSLLVADEGGSASGRAKGAGASHSLLAGSLSVDVMAERLAAKVVALAEGPVDRPWNTREIMVDLNGYRLVVFEAVGVRRSFKDVMGSVVVADEE